MSPIGDTVETDSGELAFHRAPAPEELGVLVERISEPVLALVHRAPPREKAPQVHAPLLKLHGAEPTPLPEPKLVAEAAEFNLHASRPMEAVESVVLEHFCGGVYPERRSALGGALALGRLSEGPRGTVIDRLKQARPDGTSHVVLTPWAFLSPLGWLVLHHQDGGGR